MARIVVGIDGSSGSREALELALEEARLRGATLHVVHAWRMPLAVALPEPTLAGYAAVSVDDVEKIAAQLAEQAKQLVAGELQDLLAAGPGVEVVREIVQGDPAETLIEAARGADLLVVGSRGRGGFTGLLLGSVGQHVANHAPCPLIVVPHRHAAAAR
jgi:nucleotide-binding universal stress UspA family protein